VNTPAEICEEVAAYYDAKFQAALARNDEWECGVWNGCRVAAWECARKVKQVDSETAEESK
jgi:hypothetical protein